MRKRIVGAVIAVALFVSLAVLFPVDTSAASEMKASKEIVQMIQSIEGFRAIPYWDYAQWTVGYGTECPEEDLERYRQEGIPVEEALALFDLHMGRHERAVDKFMEKHGLTLTQQQYDALISFTYNFGPNSISKDSYTIVQAITSGATGNDLIFAFSIYCMAGGEFQPGLMRRRLAEADLWFYGIYDDYPPDNYCYVRYDANGGDRDCSAQGYDSNLAAVPLSRPTKEGYTFMGWFTEPEGGKQITELNASHHGMMLYAHWQAGEVAVEFPAAPKGGINVQVTGTSVNIRSGPGTGYDVVGSANTGDILTITETKEAKGKLWGKSSIGWICLEYTNYSQIGVREEQKPPQQTQVELPGYVSVVAPSGITIYNGPHTTYPKRGSLQEEDVVQVLEYTMFHGYEWLRCEAGWIRLSNQILIHDEYKLAHNFSITSTATLAIRVAPGVGNAKVTNLKKGATVKVFAFAIVDGQPWGRIQKGWINLTYTNYSEDMTGQYQEHVFGPWYGVQDSTCSAPGTERRDCQLCSYSETREAEAVAHSFDSWQVMLQPTCTTDGQEQRTCANCGLVETEVITALGHDFGAWYETKEPTAEEAGEECRECKTCGYAEKREWKLGDHAFGPWYATLEATCLAGGIERRDCQTCDHFQERKVDALGHSYGDWYETVAPTVEEYGQERRDCSRCPDYETRQVEKLPPPPIVRTFATVICDVLRIRIGPGTSYSQIGTLYEGDRVEILESQTVDGIEWGRCEQGWICLTDYVTLETQIECVAPHVFGQWYVTQEATCLEAGQQRRDCAVCGIQETMSVEALGHDHVAVVTEPTCTEDGCTTYTCTRCADAYTDHIVAALGHRYNETTVKPTCTEDGYTSYICTRCGDSYIDHIVAALGHSYTEVTTEPTCTETGSTTYTCHCGHSYTEQIDALGHSYGEWYETVAPTMEEYGQERRDCGRCGGYETRQVDKLPVPTVQKTYAIVTCDVLRVRTGPGTEYTQVAKLYHGDRVEILEIQTVGDDQWGRCELGWICLTGYVTLEVVEEELHIYHTYGQWYEEKAATCTEAGLRRRDCTGCDHFETEEIAAHGHSFAEGICIHCGRSEALPGDLNGDGRVNSRDARLVLRYLAGLIPEDEIDLAAADYNGDGRVNVRDARAILRYVAGLE